LAYGQDKAFSVLLERFFPVWGFAQMLTHSLLEGFRDQYPDLNWNGIWIGPGSGLGWMFWIARCAEFAYVALKIFHYLIQFRTVVIFPL
jgi:hypothetical protein